MVLIIIAQVFGLLSFIFNFTSTQKAEKNQILLFNGLANMMSSFQYFALGAYSGAISTIIATLRNFVFSKFKNGVPIYILIIYLIIAISLNIGNITNIISLIPILNICTYGIAICQKDVGVLKIIMITNGTLGIIYDAYNLAIVGVCSQLLSLIGGIIGYIRYKKIKKAYA